VHSDRTWYETRIPKESIKDTSTVPIRYSVYPVPLFSTPEGIALAPIHGNVNRTIK
jgi:hypothetical protein